MPLQVETASPMRAASCTEAGAYLSLSVEQLAVEEIYQQHVLSEIDASEGDRWKPQRQEDAHAVQEEGVYYSTHYFDTASQEESNAGM
jgi:hypothetical protein